MSQKIISFILILLMATTLSIQQASANQNFVDVPSTAEAFDEINYLVSNNIINGYTENGKKYFKPSNTVTKWQAAKMVVNATGNKPVTVNKSSFRDVLAGSEASSYIERAVQLGYFELDSSGNFYPNQPLTRGEMSYILAKAYKLNVDGYSKTSAVFSDVAANSHYIQYINAIYYNGITQGSNGNFMTDTTMTRTQFALFVARATSDKYRLDLPGQVDTTQVIGMISVTTDGLNVRTSTNANDSNNIIGQVDKGGKLSVYAIEGNWLKVSYKGQYGYISKAYAKFLDGYGNEIGSVIKTVTATGALNVLYKASSSTKITNTIVKGASVQVYGELNGYYLTIVNGLPGYVLASATVNQHVESPSNSNTTPTTNLRARVTTSNLTVRASASSSSTALGTLTKGAYVNVKSISGFWAKINYNGKDGYVHKSYIKLLNQSGSVVKDRIIILDPGHGGKDPGATNGSTTEKSIVLKVTNLVKQKLEASGAKVLMTRTGDTYPSLADRVAFTEKNYGEVFISIHVNAATSSAAKGTETYYNVSTGDSYQEEAVLAKLINDEIVGNAGMYNRGVKTANYYVISNTIIPSILVELGFISNSADLAKLTSSKYIEIYAESIYQGIVQYYTKQ